VKWRNTVQDYGWRSPERPQYTGYATAKIIELLKRLKVNQIVGIEYDSKGVEIARQHFPGIAFYNQGVSSASVSPVI
jgi:hypothetical protein